MGDLIFLKAYRKCREEADKYELFSPKRELLKHEEWKILRNYSQTLINQGWSENPCQGGVISPDRAVIFYFGRDPYDGQLSPYMLEGKVTKEEFKDIAKNYVDMTDFVFAEW